MEYNGSICNELGYTKDTLRKFELVNRSISRTKHVSLWHSFLRKNEILFFEKNLIFFASDLTKCKRCVIVHNNWIVGKAAKVYRFKELGLWMYDNKNYSRVGLAGGKTGAASSDSICYYSNPRRKYIAYENPNDFGPLMTLIYETNALKSALYIGHVLNRVVILPTFHCYGCVFGRAISPICATINRCFDLNEQNCSAYKNNNTTTDNNNNSTISNRNVTSSQDLNKPNRCPLNVFFNISKFDSHFSAAYREHTFLRHPKVARNIKHSRSTKLLIESNLTLRLNLADDDVGKDFVFTPANLTFGANSTEIRSWFHGYRNLFIIRFRSLYGVIPHHRLKSSGHAAEGSDRVIFDRLEAALVPALYRQ